MGIVVAVGMQVVQYTHIGLEEIGTALKQFACAQVGGLEMN